MALINESTHFDADALATDVVGIAARIGKHDSGMHKHQKAQLLYAPQGCMNITLDGQRCVLPPTRAAWIPSGVMHCAEMNNVVEYRSLYFDELKTPRPNDRVKIIAVTPLLQALIERMSMWPWDKPSDEMKNTCALFFEELAAAQEEHLSLPMPIDSRLSRWFSIFAKGVNVAPSLNELSQHIGASSKTITRIFLKDTGMPYQDWRQQWRLLKAIELLSQGLQVNDVAYQLEFSSDSAFIAFFKKQTGCTPLKYLTANTYC
ncbi:AraC family transcriptional regulator [Vibrio aestuarianus]|uniref:AraC family transcriptional regulator n=1 Tax=Vibrio aestuarianus TaxID=28171 RepID=UPI00237CA322|nr:helix-turn-helix transcriptional regulator [Vibrio aestuarianus]MDE1264438.1 helix-turn-helix transcriptional regulator [Vibrio aestuarianus]MDE1296366.1 helix-turn-helix transcriptional regulator [Vibrio aestuarianus]